MRKRKARRVRRIDVVPPITYPSLAAAAEAANCSVSTIIRASTIGSNYNGRWQILDKPRNKCTHLTDGENTYPSISAAARATNVADSTLRYALKINQPTFDAQGKAHYWQKIDREYTPSTRTEFKVYTCQHCGKHKMQQTNPHGNKYCSNKCFLASRIITQEQFDGAIAMMQNGASRNDAATEFKMALSTLQKYMKRIGFSLRDSRKMTSQQKAIAFQHQTIGFVEIGELVEQGKRLSESKWYAVCKATRRGKICNKKFLLTYDKYRSARREARLDRLSCSCNNRWKVEGHIDYERKYGTKRK